MKHRLKIFLLGLGTISLTACSANAGLQTNQTSEHQAMMVEAYRTSESQISFLPILLIGKFALWIAGILTLYTGFDYLRSGLKHF